MSSSALSPRVRADRLALDADLLMNASSYYSTATSAIYESTPSASGHLPKLAKPAGLPYTEDQIGHQKLKQHCNALELQNRKLAAAVKKQTRMIKKLEADEVKRQVNT